MHSPICSLSSFSGNFTLWFFFFPLRLILPCIFLNHSGDYFYLSGTRVKTLSFATHKLPPGKRSLIRPLLIPRFKDNPNFESGFTSRSLPLITNCLVVLSAVFLPSPLLVLFCFFPPYISGCWGSPWEWDCSSLTADARLELISGHPKSSHRPPDHCPSLFFATFIFLEKKVLPDCRSNCCPLTGFPYCII